MAFYDDPEDDPPSDYFPYADGSEEACKQCGRELDVEENDCEDCGATLCDTCCETLNGREWSD